ncbi:MAG: EamA family transporter [Bacteroidales bacterium]|nr:EamA family transporter [Bacteroidales bacterium]
MSTILQKYERKKRRITVNGIFYAVISSMSFGFSPLFSLALIAAGLTDFDILSYRWLIAGLVLMIYAFAKKKSLRLNSFDEAWKIILLSALRAITSVTLLIGYINISSGIAATLNFMYPVIVTLTMVIFFGEKRSSIDYIAILASIFGVYLLASGDSIVAHGGNTRLGLICSLISAFSFAAYYIVMKQVKADKIEVVKFTTWIMMLSALYFVICAFIFNGKLTIMTDMRSWLNALGLGLWATMVSNITGVKGIRRIGPTMTSILGALQPFTAVILGVLFLGEHLYLRSLIGISIILVAVCIIVLHQKNRKHI